MSIESRAAKLIRDDIRALSAYHVPPAKGLIKLDAMENPYVWSDELRKQWLEQLNQYSVNRYPDANAQTVKDKLRDVMHISKEHDILLGNGSDEIIQLLAMAVAKPGSVILAPEPCFVMYRMIATYTGMRYVGVPLSAQLDIDIDATLSAIKKYNPALIFIAQPNNPTGNLFSIEKIEKIIAVSSGLVVLDEAYTAFTDADFLPWVSRFENVVIMRTLSKVGLAGLRLGLLVGAPAWLNEIEKLRLPYNINTLTQLSVEFSLTHYDVLMSQTKIIREDRQSLYDHLKTISSVTVWPSEANFLLAKMPDEQAKNIHTRLRDEFNILVKCLDGSHPLLKDCLRLTVGTSTENETLKKALSSILS